MREKKMAKMHYFSKGYRQTVLTIILYESKIKYLRKAFKKAKILMTFFN